ncbi:unnamed protein product [Caenorhabditis auriculariae]|uniref:Structure-specific endonuclease subunit SLX1 C-terminal domain-containing protein n=1 Tax=Caenorhabditis auriculariae TaxID=2777116 RepID=A0A8S1HSI4_9PELO|nr:unnamed protein product [Caenorhabditis auriculariae]
MALVEEGLGFGVVLLDLPDLPFDLLTSVIWCVITSSRAYLRAQLLGSGWNDASTTRMSFPFAESTVCGYAHCVHTLSLRDVTSSSQMDGTMKLPVKDLSSCEPDPSLVASSSGAEHRTESRSQKEEIPFPEENKPPPHVGTSYGKVEKQFSLVPEDSEGYEEAGECRLCGKEFARLWHLVRCVASPNCNAHFHTKCLAAEGLRKLGEFPKQLFPLKGKCPVCNGNYLWGDVIKEQRRIILVSAKATDEFKKMVVKKNLVVD